MLAGGVVASKFKGAAGTVVATKLEGAAGRVVASKRIAERLVVELKDQLHEFKVKKETNNVIRKKNISN